MIKAIATDIDGTITDMGRRIQWEAIEALRTLQDRGIAIMIASGNVVPVAYGLQIFIGINGPIVAENGGIVVVGDEMHYVHSRERPMEALDHLRSVMPVERLFTDRWRETQVALKLTVDPEDVRRELAGWDIEIETTGFAIHLMEKGHSKMSGVRKACELLKIDVEEVAAFGDSDNDAKMLSGCGVGIAVANASSEAKDSADYVTRAESAGGVVEGLRWLGLL